MKLDVVILQVHHLFLGFRAVIARMSDVPADLAHHASIQGLECLHLSLVLRIILELLEEEINFHSEHILACWPSSGKPNLRSAIPLARLGAGVLIVVLRLYASCLWILPSALGARQLFP